MSILTSLFKDLFTRTNQSGVSRSRDGRSPESFIDSAMKSLESNDLSSAQASYAEFLQAFPGHERTIKFQAVIHDAMLKERFPGPEYLEWLDWLHANLTPRNYVEIGVEVGKSLAFARPPTRAIGIDPAIQISYTQEAWVKLFKLTSDDFFQQHNVRDIFDAENVDLTFIDGYHSFDQALKDFINVERYCAPTSVVLFHDIFPVIHDTALRERTTAIWLGDTWKVVPILIKYRPDLKVFTIPTFPSGLTVVTNLDPGNDELRRSFENICQEAMAVELKTCLPTIDARLNVVENDFSLAKRLLAGGTQ